eukprot:scaffold6036_cov84-Cylindrotheca_fusiformis.AAC.1
MEKDRAITMGVTGYRKKRKSDTDIAQFKVGRQDNDTFLGVPRFQTHMLSSFVARVWLEVEFRFLSFEIIKFIFESLLLQRKAMNDSQVDYDFEFFKLALRV